MGFANDFYTSAAQVLPVLLLAVTVEWRLGPRSLREVYRDVPNVAIEHLVVPTAGAIALILTFALGEYGAFHALANQHATRADEVYVTGALLVSALAALLIPVFDAVGAKIDSLTDQNQRLRWRWGFGVATSITALPVYAMPAYALYQVAT